MIDLSTSVRLLLGLIVVVYSFLIVVSESRVSRRVVLAAVGIVPFLVWLVVPAALAIGEIDMALGIRRVSLLAGAAAVGLRYATMRARDRSEGMRRGFAIAGGALLLATLLVGTANWLVGAAGLVTAVATGFSTPSGESSDGARQQPQDPPAG